MNASSDTPVDSPVPPTVTCHAPEGGSVFMPGFASPHFSMVQSPVQQSPLNFYGPYTTPSMYPRQVTHSKLPHRINLIISHRCPSLSLSYQATLAFALGARTSAPNLLNRHKICASGMKNGDSLLLQAQALHNPNLETSTTTVGKSAFGYVAHTSPQMIYNFLLRWYAT